MRISTGAAGHFEDALERSNTIRRDPETGLGNTRFGRASVKKGPVYDPSRALVPFDQAFADLQIHRQESRSFWESKRQGIIAGFRQELGEAMAGGRKADALYLRARLRGFKSSSAQRIVDAHHAKNEEEARWFADKEARRASIAEQRRQDREALARSRESASFLKRSRRAKYDTLMAQGRFDEADDILAQLRDIPYSDRDEWKRARAGKRQRSAEAVAERQRVRQERQAQIQQRRDQAAAERAYQQQNRDENFAARQDALEERDRIRKRKIENREMVRDAQRRRKENERRDRESKKLEDRKHKDSVKLTKGMARLTRHFMLASAGGGVAMSAIRGVTGVFAKAYDSVSQSVIGNENFTKYRGVSTKDAAALSMIGARFGLNDSAIKNFVGGLSSQLAMSNLQMTDFMKNLAYWHIDHTNKNGGMADAMTILRRMGQAMSGRSNIEKQQFMSMFGINEDMMSLIESVKNGTGNLKGYEDLWGNSQKVNESAKHYQMYKDLWEKEKQSQYAKGDLRGMLTGFFYDLGQSMNVDALAARMNWSSVIDEKMKSGKRAAASSFTIDKSGLNNTGKKEITVNLGGQEFYFKGNTTREIMQEVKERMMPEIAQSIVDQLQIYEGD